MTAGWTLRAVQAADLPGYRTLRLAALAAHPDAYSSSVEEEQAQDDATWRARMLPSPPGVRIGGFVGPALVAIGGLIVSAEAKTRHVGLITGLYVDPAHRRDGLARALMDALLAAARQAELRIVHLSVSVGNEAAGALYRRSGFTRYGVFPGMLRIGERLVDTELLLRHLD